MISQVVSALLIIVRSCQERVKSASNRIRREHYIMSSVFRPFMVMSYLIFCLSACGAGGETRSETPQDQGVVSSDMNQGEQSSSDVSPSASRDGGASLDMSVTDPLDASPTVDMRLAGDAAADAETHREVLSYRDLAYTPPPEVTSELATLDLFRFDDGQVRPLVLLVHGGSWVGGDKAGFEPNFVPWWLARGYVAAPVNFRLASTPGQTPVVKPRDQARDIAAALAWLISHAEEYQISTREVVLLGYSSGAHLVALLATDERFLREAGLSESQIAAVISLDVHAYDVPFALGLMAGSVVEGNIPVIRHLFGMTESEQLASSPINYIDGWAAKSLIISVDESPEIVGTHGYIVSRAAERYVAALRAAGHQARAVHDSTETHSSLVMGFGAMGDITTEAILTLLDSL